MSLRIGRLGVDVEQTNVAGLVGGGNNLVISGLVSDGGFGAAVLREQFTNLKENPYELFYPVVYDEHPWINGYYTVTDCSVTMSTGGSLAIGWFPFTVSLTRLSTSAVPLVEARTLGTLRGNFVGVTQAMAWLAMPDLASGFDSRMAIPATLTVEPRLVSEGKIRVYRTPDGDPLTDPGLIDAFSTYMVPPENWYDGAARIRTGLLERISTTTFEHTGDVQTYTVPAGIDKLIVDVMGAQGGGRWGARGGRIVCDLDVTAGEVLQVNVGGQGSPLRTGGWNGGGDGGTATPRHHGSGGGGASDIRQGGIALANRVVVAGGGGGSGGANPSPVGRIYSGYPAGRGGGVHGEPGETTLGGRQGTATAGGDPGTPYPTRNSGTAGSLGVGGVGANAPTPDSYAGGGAGGGLFGGGGGSEDVFFGAGGSGAGGSGLSTGLNQITKNGTRAGNGRITITPVASQPNIRRYTVIGDQAPNAPLGWELSNGMVRLMPVYVSGAVQFDTEVWDGGRWVSSTRWAIGDNVGITFNAQATAAVILLNTPEECIIQVTYEWTDRSGVAVATFSLRRGAPVVSIKIVGASRHWAVRQTGSSPGTTATGKITQTTADGGGHKWVIYSPYVVTDHLGPGTPGYALTSLGTALVVAVGFVPAWITSSEDALLRQWFAAMTESVKAVIR